jgi:cytochrome c
MITGAGSYLLKTLPILFLILTIIPAEAQVFTPEKKILVFSKTIGFRHSSIPTGQKRLFAIGQQLGIQVDTTENAALFTEENLRRYQGIVFLNTTGNVLNEKQQEAFERYIQAGGGFAGIHAATDTEYEWPWYTRLVGAQFDGHPSNPNVQEGVAIAVNHTHPSMEGFPDKWKVKDEFYDFKNVYKHLNVLVKIDEKTYKEGKMGNNHPMSWYHEYDGGKAFYTNFGHTDETYDDEVFIKHVTGGLKLLKD